MLLTLAKAIIIPHKSAAEDDSPPTGIEPWTTALIPLGKRWNLLKEITAPLI